MAYFKDMREFLTALEGIGKLRRITREINKDTELHPIVRWNFRGLPESERFGFLFENVKGFHGEKYRGGVASAVIAPCLENYAMALGCEPTRKAILDRWAQAYKQPIPTRSVKTGPVKEEIHKGDKLLEHGGLHEFPIPMTTNGWESLPRLTGVCWMSRDPDTGSMNVGTYNGVVMGPAQSSARVSPRADLRVHWQKYKAKGLPLPVVAVIGAVPVVAATSITEMPYGVNELDVAGGLAGEALEVVRCETMDIEVPASAEVVLEGEIPTDFLIPDPPSGEHTGYTFIDRMVFSFNVKCITHRKNPIWHDLVDQFPPSESSVMGNLTREALMTTFLRNSCGIQQVKDVAFHHCGGSRRLCVIRMQDFGTTRTSPRVVWRTLHCAMAISSEWPKIIIAVDSDIDPWDLESVFWGVSFRYQPHRDTQIIQGRGATADQSAGPRNQSLEDQEYPASRTGLSGNSSILIDATRKWPYTPTSLPTKAYMDRGREIWEEIGLPTLKPMEPWYGVNWGEWPEKYQRHAEMADRGEFEKIAEELMRDKKKI